MKKGLLIADSGPIFSLALIENQAVVGVPANNVLSLLL
jgi:hypothetical protein